MSYKNGDIIRGVVSGIQPYGAFVRIDEETTGLVHISEISNGYVKNVEDFIQLNKEYSFYVIEYDEERKHAKLSFKKINDADKIKRKTSRNRSHFNDFDSYTIYFNDTLKLVDDDLNSLKNNTISVESNNFYGKDIEINDLDKFINDSIEKDFLKVQQESFADRENLDYLVVICDNEFEVLTKGFIELYNNQIDNKIIYVKEDIPTSSVYKLLGKLTNKKFKVIYTIKEDNIYLLSIYRLLKKKMVDNELDDKAGFVFFINDNNDTKNAINKESYLYFQDQVIDNKYGLVSLASLYVLGFAGLDVFGLINGYRKAIIDVKNDPSLVQKLLIVNCFEKEETEYYFNRWLNELSIYGILVETYSSELQIPSFKDNLGLLKPLEGKNLSELTSVLRKPRIVLNNVDSFSLGYLGLILIVTSLNK